MPDHTSAAAFADFAQHLGSLTTTTMVIEAFEQTASAVLGHGEVSLLLVQQRQLVVAGSTDKSVATATAGQLDLGEGPALDAARGPSQVACADLAAAPDWPRWSPCAYSLGWRSWLSVRLSSRSQRCLGVLDVASRNPDDIDADLASILAAHLAVAIDSVRLQETLLLAQDAQMHVGQAVGLLMERYQLTADQALAVLRRYSQQRQVKLREIATDLLATRALPNVDTHGQ